ncbi:MAG: TonB-dependent receptor [Bryobacteraceae bacterium]|nr:TonB-dependent receptor [Bryobacteraceae bacterium]
MEPEGRPEKDRISFYFGWNEQLEAPGPLGVNTLPGLYSDFLDLNRKSKVYRATWDHNFTPTLLNQFRGGGNDWREGHDSVQEKIGGWKDKFCIAGAPDCDYNLGVLRFSEYTQWGAYSNNGSENLVYSFADDMTWIRGKHTLKFGGMYQLGAYNGYGRQCVAGCADFSYLGTGRAFDENFGTAGGNSFASFLLGWATNGSIDTVRYIGQQWPYFAGYVQDDWKLSSKLTVNLGLRWDMTLPPREELDRWSDFSPTTPNPGADNRLGALIYAGSGEGRQGSRTLADSWFRGFGPRIGLAYSWDSKTVIRTNFARSFSQVTTTTGSTHQKGFTQTFGFGTTASGTAPTFLLRDQLPPYPVPPFISPSFQNGADMPWWQGQEVTRLPEQLSWNLSVQRQLTSSLVLDVGYNAVAGSHLQAGLLNYNQVPTFYAQRLTNAQLGLRFNDPGQAAQIAGLGFGLPYTDFVRNFGNRATLAQSLRPYPQYTDINTWDGNGDHSGHSSYHAAIVKLDKRFAQGLSFTTSYVFSKMLTDADSYWITDQSWAADHYNRRLEKSIGSYDVTHNYKLGLTYELPFGKGKRWANSGVANWVIGGWRLSSINLYASGRPIAISGGSGLGIFTGRQPAFITSYDNWRAPERSGSFDPQVTGNGDRFLDITAFPSQSAVRGIGNSTRFNPKVREFANLTENVSVAKSLRFGGDRGITAEIRGEAFNLFNRHRFGNGGTNVSDPNSFGRVTNVINDPRRLQVGAKITF